MRILSLILIALAAGVSYILMSRGQEPANEPKPAPMFLPKPIEDEWTRWMVGEWVGTGKSDAGKGKFKCKIELGLNGQFLIMSGEAEIAEVNTNYLKKNMHASEEEIERFLNSPYKALEIYTIDQKTGEVVGYLFDSLRCVAQGRGKREANKETVHWQWTSGHKSTRITEKISEDKLAVIERTPMPDGSTMEDKGEMTRIKK